ncbi:MAG TPA: hypothetical protein PK014_14775 [Thermoanaerobaculia bacterium]|mgnify:CR=1 FL=1|nr:hypothetical protein [Thermoanaerobaculia bacterium]HUM31290.1 hypothetical protein [Thermoanaerobaculia bacterium]HXK69639.1 hypothetical protein [Thermoanaerobaculia bacterium]
MNRTPIKNILAVGLVCLLIFVIYKQFRPSAGSVKQSREAARRAQATAEAIPALHLNLLEPKPTTTREDGRNIFRYYQPPPPKPTPAPPPPPPDPETVKQRQAEQQQRMEEMRKAQEEKQKPKPPAITFKYLGHFGPEGRLLAVFVNDGEILDVFEGETFLDKYILHKIGLESVSIGFVGFPDNEPEILQVGS